MHKSIYMGLRTLAVASLFCLTISGSATAQKYKADPVEAMEARAERVLQGSIRKMLKGSAPLDAQSFDKWYNKSYLPKMTSPKVGDLAKLADRRRALVKELAVAGANESAHQALVKAVREKAMSVAAGKYHPSVKFNFVYLLGLLNETEASRQPAVPLKSTLPALIQLASKGDTDAVKVAALLGIQRHVELRGQFPAISGELSTDEKNRIVALLRGFVEMSAPPKGRTESGHGWMQTIAAESMGYVADPRSAASLGKLVARQNASLSARCAATKALGRLDLSKQSISAKLVPLTARLAYECCSIEHNELSHFHEEMQKSGGEESSYADPRSVPSRRRLLACLLDIKAGLAGPDGKGGLKAAVPAAEQVLQQVNTTIDAVKDSASNADELGGVIQRQATRFKTLATS